MSNELCVVIPLDKLERLMSMYDHKLVRFESRNAINFQDLKTIVNNVKSKDDKAYIHELLQGCQLEMPSPKAKPRDPELEARVQKLKVEQANREYRRMTANVSLCNESYRSNISQIGNDVKSANAQVVAVINFVLTVGGSFLFAYKAVEYSLPQPHISSQVLMGILVATVVAIADLYFLIRSM